MGKKNKKKSKGSEKTSAKTDKKLSQKMKKELAVSGEADVEDMVAKIEQEEKERLHAIEQIVRPTRRANFSLSAHPDKDELLLFGGEFFNGQKTSLFNDLFVYNIGRDEWTLTKAPGGPGPRCSHQAVALPTGRGQLWVFGGEYASPTQSQFYHYGDLWCYHLDTKQWEKISSAGAPLCRSGHRMVYMKKQLIVFGGFHDNLRDYKYFNDVYTFSLEDRTWRKLETTGTVPAPRSACQMVALPEGKILVWGGYSKTKVKKDVDKGTVHSDMFLLAPEKGDESGVKWKWTSVKAGGARPGPRSGVAMAQAAGATGKVYTYGGVRDDEKEEDIEGEFYDELHSLELERRIWRTVSFSEKKDTAKQKRRRRKEKDDVGGDLSDCEMEVDGEKSGELNQAEEVTTVSEDGVFVVKMGRAPAENVIAKCPGIAGAVTLFTPHPRMNCGLAIKHATLFLYGGLYEENDIQYTLDDFYSLDLRKLDEWKTLIPNSMAAQEWLASDSESEEDSEESDDDSVDGNEEEAMDTA